MGKVVRSQRKGKGSVFKAHTTGRKGPVAMKQYDYAERHGYVKGVVKDIVHDSGRGAPVAKIQFKDGYQFKRINTLLAAPEGLYSGQFIFSGKKGKQHFHLSCQTVWLAPLLHKQCAKRALVTHISLSLQQLLLPSETSCPLPRSPKVP